MSGKTNIEWCDHTWSPWRGCTKVSPGCANCYAEGLAKRFGPGWGGWGKGATRVPAKDWREPLRWDRAAADAQREWLSEVVNVGGGARLHAPSLPTVFPSLCDLFDDEVEIPLFCRALDLIRVTPNLRWLVLSKRVHLWSERMSHALGHCVSLATATSAPLRDWCADWINGYPPANVWVGTSVEDQKRADERIPALLQIPAAGRFLSVEPLLGPVQLMLDRIDGDARFLHAPDCPNFCEYSCGGSEISGPIDWCIVGGESGPGARPCNVEWVRSIVRQCAAAGTPCFVKQLGARPTDRNDRGFEGDSGPMGWPMDTETVDDVEPPGPYQGKPVRIRPKHPKGGDPAEWPADLRVRQFPEGLR